MKLQQRLVEYTGWKSAGALLSYAIFLGMLTIAVTGFLFVWRPMSDSRALAERLEASKQRIRQLEQLPVKSDPGRDGLEDYARRIPVAEELGTFVLSLRALERQTGVSLLKLDTKSTGSGDNELQAQFQALNLSQGGYSASTPKSQTQAAAGSSAAGPSPAGGTPAQSEAPRSVLTMMEERQLQLVVSGSYEESASFVGGLRGMERFVNVHGWKIESAAGAAVGVREKVKVTIDLTIYTASKLAGILPPLPKTAIPPGSGRSDPTLSESALSQELHQAASKELEAR
jgi:Tfp pilus assembly protein PilO